MSRESIDLIGTIHLLKTGGRLTPIRSGYRAHCNIKGETRQDSFIVWFKDREILSPGENCECEFCFLFRNHKNFEKSVSDGQILELNEGDRKIGELLIKSVLNLHLKNST